MLTAKDVSDRFRDIPDNSSGYKEVTVAKESSFPREEKSYSNLKISASDFIKIMEEMKEKLDFGIEFLEMASFYTEEEPTYVFRLKPYNYSIFAEVSICYGDNEILLFINELCYERYMTGFNTICSFIESKIYS